MILGKDAQNQRETEPTVAIEFTESELEFITTTMGRSSINLAESFKAVKTLSKIQEGYQKLKSTQKK